MASKIVPKIRLSTKKKYITYGGHIVTPIEKCSCGAYDCQVRKDGRFVRPKNAMFVSDSTKKVNGEHVRVVHYTADGKLSTAADEQTRKRSAFDIVAVWEE